MRRALVFLLAIAMLSAPALARKLNFEILPVGYVMTPDEVLDNIGQARMGRANEDPGALLVKDMQATTSRLDDPAWLLMSNAPELINDITMPRRRGVLVAADLPAGSGRLLVSHANQFPMGEDFIIHATNMSPDEVAQVVLEPSAHANQVDIPASYRADALVGGALIENYEHATQVLPLGWRPPDDVTRFAIRPGASVDMRLVPSAHGLSMFIGKLTTSAPLHVAVCAVPRDGKYTEDTPLTQRTGSQARGLFDKPDVSVEANVDLSDMVPLRYVFGQSERDNRLGVLEGGNWMTGVDTTEPGHKDPQTNRGDFGGFTHFKAHVTADGPSKVRGAAFILVCGGRKAAVPRGGPGSGGSGGKVTVLSQWNGLVLARVRVGDDFSYDFTLPPNSWAPMYMVAVPLFSMPR
jgi:hypothetical protein